MNMIWLVKMLYQRYTFSYDTFNPLYMYSHITLSQLMQLWDFISIHLKAPNYSIWYGGLYMFLGLLTTCRSRFMMQIISKCDRQFFLYFLLIAPCKYNEERQTGIHLPDIIIVSNQELCSSWTSVLLMTSKCFFPYI